MTVAQIDPLSEPPSRADPDNFPERSDTFLAEIGPFALQANALALQVNGFAVDAAASALAASNSEAAALASKNAASVSELNAANSESAAAVSASEAEASALAASKLNLGPKAAPPTTDNQGDPLLSGATYYDITLEKWLVWAGTGWTEGLSAIAGVSSVNGQTGAVSITVVPYFVLMNLGVI